MIVEDTNVLEINPDALPDGVEAVAAGSNAIVDTIVATTVNEYDGVDPNQNAITACILDTEETRTGTMERGLIYQHFRICTQATWAKGC